MPLDDDERRKYEQALLELRTLQRVAIEVARTLDLEVVLGRCLDLTIEAAHAMAGVIYLCDPVRDLFRRVQVRAIDDAVAPPQLPSQRLREVLAASSHQIECVPDAPSPMVVAAYHAGI